MAKLIEMFQYLIGRIKPLAPNGALMEINGFQYLIGRIKPRSF